MTKNTQVKTVILKFFKSLLAKFQELEGKQASYINSLRASKDRKNEIRKKENQQKYDEIQNLQEECSGLALEKIEISNQIQDQAILKENSINIKNFY